MGIDIVKQWSDDKGTIHQILYRQIQEHDVQEPEPKIEKRGRLDILQVLTERGAKWGLATNPATPSRIQASVMGNDDDEEFNDIRKAIDWIIEQICEGER